MMDGPPFFAGSSHTPGPPHKFCEICWVVRLIILACIAGWTFWNGGF